MSGTVVRVQTSIPVINARVILGQDSTVTDSAGKYLFAEVVEGVYPISVMCDSFGYYHDNITVKRDLIYNVPLVPAVRLFGKVYDHLMQPLGGAIVEAGGIVDTTQVDGGYQLPNVPTGNRELSCYHPEHYRFVVTINIPSVPFEFNIYLYPAANLFGIVYGDSGRPLSGAVVSVAGLGDTSGQWGGYELKEVPLGHQSLSCTHQDYFDHTEEIEVTMAPTRVDVVMDNLVNLIGTVSNQYYGLVAGAEISIAGLKDTSDLNGHYQFRNVQLGFQGITCTHPQYFFAPDTISITQSLKIYDIKMLRAVKETLYVEEDVTLEAHLQGFRDDCGGLGGVATSYPYAERLDIYGSSWIEYPYPDDHYFYYRYCEIERFYVKLPFRQKSDAFISAEFLLYCFGGDTRVWYKFTESDWAESTLTWSTQPADADQHFSYFEPSAGSEISIDLTSIYEDLEYHMPALFFWAGVPNPWELDAWASFASSENADLSKRPKVIITSLY
ncbi:MAG: DNRLRE domain-containing protein [Candidatus Zixiibacteriota bacterium]